MVWIYLGIEMKHCFEFPNKKRYSTKKEAEIALLKMAELNLKIYYCEACSGWHLAKI
jgi:hypothetical protein